TPNLARAQAPGIATGRYGSIGEIILVERDYWPLNTALYSIELYDNNIRFVWYLLQSLSEHFHLNSMKSAVPGVDRNDVHMVKVVLPPVEEQAEISIYLDREEQVISEVIAQAESTISLLQER